MKTGTPSTKMGVWRLMTVVKPFVTEATTTMPIMWNTSGHDGHRLRYISPDECEYEDISEEQLTMLRRGATLQMITLFSMTYSHEDGLRAAANGNELYLGWNIELNDDDQSGEEFMDFIVADVLERPDRWDK